MEQSRWQRVEELYHSALDLAPDKRAAFLAQACASDPELRREVEQLLDLDDATEGLLDRPAWEQASGVLASRRLQAGTLLGPYRVSHRLGAGGMGSVYLAEDTRLRRNVAVKLLRSSAPSSNMRQRLEREAQLISSLNHPHICALYDIGSQDGTDFLVMEHVEGETLASRLRQGPLPPEMAMRMGAQIADALGAAHSKGIVHRDLKPDNIMLTSSGAKVLDFGLAKLTHGSPFVAPEQTLTGEGAFVGTPAYMAPEQLEGRECDARTDIFAFGLVLYEMLTCRRPFAADSAPRIMTAVLRDTPASPRSVNPQISPELERLILKCLHKSPERRYQSAKKVEHDLNQIGSSSSGRRPSRRQVSIAAVILVAILAAALLWQRPPTFVSSRIDSLAVLPLDNLSGDPTQDYFAEGMTEVLITDLGKTGSLRVISRAPVMKYKGSRLPLREIASELKVDALVVGSVARAEGKVRITTQLYDASKDRQLWAEDYERDMRDVIVLQRDVAQAITSEIKAKVTPQETVRLNKARRVDPEAYDRYLRAVLFYSRHTIADNDAAIGTLDQALARDPNFAAAHALLAAACVERFFTFAPQEQKALEEKAYVAVEKAIALDADESMAWFARGRLLWTPSNRFPHERAIREYRHALALNPNSAEARAQLALTYNHVGLLEDALREAHAAADINPVDALPRVVVGQALLYDGQYDRALDVWSSNPPDAYASVTGSHLAWTLFQMARTEEATAKIAEFLAKYPSDVGGLGVRAVLLAVSGRNSEAEAVIRSISGQKGFGHFHHTAYYIACAYARMGNRDAALDWLREAADTGFACYPLFERDPNLKLLHGHPRWGPMMSEYRQAWDRYRKLTSDKT